MQTFDWHQRRSAGTMDPEPSKPFGFATILPLETFWFPVKCQRGCKITLTDPQPTSFMVRTRALSDRLLSSNFHS